MLRDADRARAADGGVSHGRPEQQATYRGQLFDLSTLPQRANAAGAGQGFA